MRTPAAPILIPNPQSLIPLSPMRWYWIDKFIEFESGR